MVEATWRDRRRRGAVLALVAIGLFASCGSSKDLGSPDLGIQRIEGPTDACDEEDACAEAFSVVGVGFQISCDEMPEGSLDLDPPIATGDIGDVTPSIVGRIKGIPVEVAVGVSMDTEGPCRLGMMPLLTWAARPGDYLEARTAICGRYPEISDDC